MLDQTEYTKLQLNKNINCFNYRNLSITNKSVILQLFSYINLLKLYTNILFFHSQMYKFNFTSATVSMVWKGIIGKNFSYRNSAEMHKMSNVTLSLWKANCCVLLSVPCTFERLHRYTGILNTRQQLPPEEQ